MSRSFVGLPKPFLCAAINELNPEDSILAMRTSAFDGAQAFLFDLARLDRVHHNVTDLSRIFNSTTKPVMVYYYRLQADAEDAEVSDEVRANVLRMSIEAGATAIDMMADLFDPSELELSRNAGAIDKQAELMREVRALGGEVMISSHTLVEMSTDAVLSHVREIAAREPDMVKIVPRVPTVDSLVEAMRTTVALERELSLPFIHIVMGEYNAIHRIVGPMLGSALCFCVPYYNERSTIEQPLLRATKQVFDNFVWERRSTPGGSV